MLRTAFALALVFAITHTGAAQDAVTTQVDGVFADYAKPGSPR